MSRYLLRRGNCKSLIIRTGHSSPSFIVFTRASGQVLRRGRSGGRSEKACVLTSPPRPSSGGVAVVGSAWHPLLQGGELTPPTINHLIWTVLLWERVDFS